MGLLPQHAELIEKSAISAEVARDRGYRSVEKKIELEELGFGRRQQRVPGLLAPIWDVTGERRTYLLRPDEPYIKDGRPLKYEIPSGSTMTVDVPPACLSDLDDPSVPLFITEGVRKADAAVTIGLCCISLIGTWAWRGTNDKGGKTALPDFESIALNDREVYVAFDSDVMTKPSVHAALARLAPFLKKRDAKVRFIYLPPGEKGKKVGLDDFIAAGNGAKELFAEAGSELRRLPDADRGHDQYVETEKGIVWNKPAQGGHTPVGLTNFNARIIADIVKDDGVEQTRELEVETVFKGRSKHSRIPAERFPSMNWVITEVGAGAAVEPGFIQKDRARHAIQILSGEPPEHWIYEHLGWRAVDDHQLYLHAGGAIGPEGAIEGIEMDLTGTLADFTLPEPPQGDDLREAVRASLALAEIGPDEIALPLLAAVYRAPLGESDFNVFMVGPTGQFKTALAAVCQQHWGPALDERNLPESFRSTPNAIEGLLFQAKDALVVVDEFAPGGTQSEIARAHRDADRVLRSQGNRAGRARMRADGTLKIAKRPRGLTLVTGEDVPEGQSLRARMIVLEIGPGAIDVAKLTELQEAGSDGLLAKGMAGYVRYLAAEPERIHNFRAERDELRRQLANADQHRRTPTLVADLLVGFRNFISFAIDAGAIDAAVAEELEARAQAALKLAAARQGRQQADAEPTQRFRTLLASALASGVAHVAAADGSQPEDPVGWGWRSHETAFETEWRPQGARVGWLKGGDLYLDLDAALGSAQKAAGSSGMGVAVTAATLRKRLHEHRLLVSTELESRETYNVRRELEGKRREVLHVRAEFVGARGRGGRVGEEAVRDFTTGGGADAAQQSLSPRDADTAPPSSAPDQSDRSTPDEPTLAELDAEIESVQEKHPDLFEVEE